MRRILNSLTYANVMSTIAVFIALGGVSYAAVKLPKNSVGSAQIKKNAVTLNKIAPKARRALAGAGATGAAGAPGAKGDKGEGGTLATASEFYGFANVEGDYEPIDEVDVGDGANEIKPGKYFVVTTLRVWNAHEISRTVHCSSGTIDWGIGDQSISFPNTTADQKGNLTIAGSIELTAGQTFVVDCEVLPAAGSNAAMVWSQTSMIPVTDIDYEED